MAAFFLFPECENNHHDDCLQDKDLPPPELLEQGFAGGALCSCECHRTKDDS